MERTPIHIEPLVERVLANYPELAPLRALANDGNGRPTITREYLLEHEAFEGEGKHSLLRALLGDVSLFKLPPGEISTDVCRALTRFLRFHPRAPLALGEFERNDLPQHLATLIGIERTSFHAFLGALLPALWADACGGASWSPSKDSPWPSDAGARADCIAELRPLLAARILDRPRARRLLAGGVTPRHSAYFFATGVDALDVRNAMVFLSLALEDRRGGRVQNNVPLQLSRRFGIAPRSVPDTLAALDVVALVMSGALDLARVDDDWMRLRELVAAETPEGWWDDVATPHLARALLGVDHPLREVEGIYDSGLLMNTRRLVGLVPGKRARLEAFVPYYEHVDGARLLELAAPIWQRIDHALPRRVLAGMNRHPDLFAGIGVRDYGNILAFVALSGSTSGLPSVARFALGEAEPVATGTGRRRGTPARAQDKGSRAFALPLLEALERMPLADTRHAYVVHPGFSGELPADAPIYFPRALAATFADIPSNVILTGPTTVPWGADPYARPLHPEWSDRVLLHLKPAIAVGRDLAH